MTIQSASFSRPQKVSTLDIDTDLDLGAYKLKADHVAESTASHKVVFDNTLSATLVDGTTVQGATVKADHLAEKTTSHNTVVDTPLSLLNAVTVAATSPQLKATDGEQTTASTAYVKLLEVQLANNLIGSGNSLDVYFEMKGESASYTVYGLIYVNGVAKGTERSATSTSYAGYNETISNLQGGDLVQLYVKAYSASHAAFVRYLRLRGTLTPAIIGGATW